MPERHIHKDQEERVSHSGVANVAIGKETDRAVAAARSSTAADHGTSFAR